MDEWDDDQDIIEADQRFEAREHLTQSVGTLPTPIAAEIVSAPRKVWVNPFEALLDEVRRTNAYVVMLGIEVDQYDAQHGGAHKFRASRSTLARYERERDRLIAVCKTAISLGIAEKHVRLAEQHGELMARMAVAAIDKAGVTPEQRRLILQELAAQMRANSQSADLQRITA